MQGIPKARSQGDMKNMTISYACILYYKIFLYNTKIITAVIFIDSDRRRAGENGSTVINILDNQLQGIRHRLVHSSLGYND